MSDEVLANTGYSFRLSCTKIEHNYAVNLHYEKFELIFMILSRLKFRINPFKKYIIQQRPHYRPKMPSIPNHFSFY